MSTPSAAGRLRAVLGAALIVMSGFVVSKALGLLRNVVMSHQFGTSREYETFLAALSVPDAVFQIMAGGAVSAAFIPIYTSYLSGADRDKAWELLSGLMNLAIIALGVASLGLSLLTPWLVGVLVPGWGEPERAQVASLTRLLLICPAIFAVSTLATSALNGAQRFALAAAAPLMYHLSLIAAALLLRPLGAEGLGIGAVGGALLHLAVQIPGLARIGMRYRLTLGLRLAGTAQVARLMVPRAIGLGISQLTQLINVALASFLVQGSIAYLSYAWLILMFPLGVFAMAVSTAIFPTLATQSATGQRDEQRATFVFGLRLILFLTVPAAVGLIVLGKPLVALLLERGAFDARATEATAFALAFMAIGLPGHALIEIVNRAFYAERDTVTPVKVGAAGAALDLLLASVLMRTPLSFGGLALAAAIWALFEAAVLMIILQRRTGLVPPGELAGFGWRISLSAATMGIVAVGLQRALSSIVHPSAWAQTAVLFAVGLTAVFVYLALARALGVDDARRAAGLLRPRVHPG